MLSQAVILAGGAGTRLWPASIRSQPKQFLKVVEGKTLLQLSVGRAMALGVGRIVIVTHQSQAERVAEDLQAIKDGNIKERTIILSEPVARNTGPALAFAAHFLSSIDSPDSTCIVMPADHIVTPVDAFVADTAAADRLARDGYLVTYGIRPTRPETGYGYIETSEPLPGGWAVHTFREKPDYSTAVHYLKAGNYYWNSGMFVYRNDVFLEELSRHTPSIADAFAELPKQFRTRKVRGIRVAGDVAELSALYPRVESLSVDYAVMERSDRRAMVMSTFNWNDVGSWDEIAAISSQEGAGTNREDVPAISVQAPGCYVDSDLPVAVCGVEDVHVIVKNGMVLVCRKGASQLVKSAVEEMRNRGYERLL